MKKIFDKKSERDLIKGITTNKRLNCLGIIYLSFLSILYGFHLASWSIYSNLIIPLVVIIAFSRLNVRRLSNNYKIEMEKQFEIGVG